MPRNESGPRLSPRVLVAAPVHMVGGHARAARDIVEGFREDSRLTVALHAIDPRLPAPLTFLTETPVLRTLTRPLLSALTLARRAPEVDVVHVFCAAHLAFVLGALPALLVAWLYRKPVVLNYHDGRARAHLRWWGPLVRWAARRASAVVFPSEFLREVFAAHGIAGDVVPNVVDPGVFGPPPRRVLPRRMVSARLLERLYAVDNTIRAFARVRAEEPGATLEIYGAGSQRSSLEALVQRLGVGGVRFCGELPYEAMPAMLREGGVLVNSSRVDNLPHILLEAFAAGLPIVTTAPGGIRYIVRHEHTALVVPTDDPEAMAAAVLRVMRDPPLATRLAEAGRRELVRYSWSAAAQGWHRVYLSVARRPAAEPLRATRVGESQ